jgi:hypothetical protein
MGLVGFADQLKMRRSVAGIRAWVQSRYAFGFDIDWEPGRADLRPGDLRRSHHATIDVFCGRHLLVAKLRQADG